MSTIPAGVLSSILDRLDQLEQNRQGVDEALSPSYLTIDPVTGLVPVIIDSAGNSIFVQLAGPARQQRMGNPARAHRHGAITLAAGSYTGLGVDTIDSDPDGAFTAGSYLAPYAGAYFAVGACQAQLANNPQVFLWTIGKNNSEYARGTSTTIRGGTPGDVYGGLAWAIVPCAVGDTIQLLIYNNGGNTCAVFPDTGYLHVQQIA